MLSVSTLAMGQPVGRANRNGGYRGFDQRSGDFGRNEVIGPHSGPYGRDEVAGPHSGPYRRGAASIIVPATAVCRSAFRPTDWGRCTPVRPALSAARSAAVASEIAPHWGAALPVAWIMIEARGAIPSGPLWGPCALGATMIKAFTAFDYGFGQTRHWPLALDRQAKAEALDSKCAAPAATMIKAQGAQFTTKHNRPCEPENPAAIERRRWP